MRKLRILKDILINTHADKMLLSFLLFILLDALVICWCEPSFHTYGDALWYCYAVITTIGFGDLVVTTFLGKVLTVILSAYAILVIGIVTGIIVNFYTELLKLQKETNLSTFLDKAEHLSDLNKEELDELSQNIAKYRWRN
ncbi:MAG: potassium channel family protein [Eubacteriales bacterium]